MDHDGRATGGTDFGLVDATPDAAAQFVRELAARSGGADEWVAVNSWGARASATKDDLARAAQIPYLSAEIEPGTPATSSNPSFPLGTLNQDLLSDLSVAWSESSAEQQQIRDMPHGTTLAEWLLDAGVALNLVVELNPPWALWIRSHEDYECLTERWPTTANLATNADAINVVGGQPHKLSRIEPKSRPLNGNAIVPAVTRVQAGSAEHPVNSAMNTIADAVCWLHLAHSVEQTADGYNIELHEHQEPFKLCLDDVHASPQDLLTWATSTPDPLRLEALRHVFRSTSTIGLPDPRVVARSASQYLLLFSQTRSAEVLHARDSTLTSLKASLGEAYSAIGESVRDALRDGLASIISIVGVIAAASRLGPQATIIGAVALAVAIAVLIPATARARVVRISSSLSTLANEVEEIRASPFLTEDDRRVLVRRADEDRLRTLGRRTKIWVVVIAGASILSTMLILVAGYITSPARTPDEIPDTPEPATTSLATPIGH